MSKRGILFLQQTDKKLARIISRVEAFPLREDFKSSPFESLAESIVHQQLHGKAAHAIWVRLCGLSGGKKLPPPEKLLKLQEKTLRGAGLSRGKILALRDLARKTKERVVPSWTVLQKLPDKEIIERLTEVRGIGPWTVQMMLMFRLGRLDVLPAADFGIQNGFGLVYGLSDLPKPKELLDFGEKWKPYRSIASWYLWRAVDLSREQEKLKKERNSAVQKTKAKIRGKSLKSK